MKKVMIGSVLTTEEELEEYNGYDILEFLVFLKENSNLKKERKEDFDSEIDDFLMLLSEMSLNDKNSLKVLEEKIDQKNENGKSISKIILKDEEYKIKIDNIIIDKNQLEKFNSLVVVDEIYKAIKKLKKMKVDKGYILTLQNRVFMICKMCKKGNKIANDKMDSYMTQKLSENKVFVKFINF